jgi:hypothetical protein
MTITCYDDHVASDASVRARARSFALKRDTTTDTDFEQENVGIRMYTLHRLLMKFKR